MKRSEIEAGKTYINVRSGRTRTVTRLRTDWEGHVFVHYLLPPPIFGDFCLLATFARWAGKEVK